MQKNSETYNKNAVDAIMANFKNPYEIGSDFAKRRANPYKTEPAHFGQTESLAANGASFGLPQTDTVPETPDSWGGKVKDFLGTGTGRALLAGGLTGALTAAFGGSPLEAASYGAQSGGRASNIYLNELKEQELLDQRREELYQKAFDDEQNRRLKIQEMQTNTELRKMMADAAYQRALDLNEQKNAFAMQAQDRKRAYQIEDRDLDYERAAQNSLRARDWEMQDRAQDRRYALEDDFRKRDWTLQDNETARRYHLEDEDARRLNALQDAETAYERDLAKKAYDFELRKELAALNYDFDREKTAQSFQNEIEKTILDGDIDKAADLYKMQLQLDKELRLLEEEQALKAEMPTDKVRTYDELIKRGVHPNDALNIVSRRRIYPRRWQGTK